MKSKQEIFYIADRYVCPDEDLVLCAVDDDEMERLVKGRSCKVQIYGTKNGMFYSVTDGEKFKVLSKIEVKKYLDQHVKDINKENYDLIFGKPVRG